MNKYIGKRLDGRYELKELVGIGGMADVYKAFDLQEKKMVAVKILKDEFLTHEDFKRRFRNESKAIAVLSHPNIVKVFDVSFGDRIQFIVMEYINGITLKEYVEQQGVVNWKETVHFTVQILRALQHAHDNGIVHRDVKPQNVMLLQDGTVKIMDFGIARFARDNGRTISEKAIGSVHYISPEQARGEVTDEKTDIYSVGVMMFELLTGKLPFDGDSPVAIALKQMQQPPPILRSLNPDVPEGLEEIVGRAMKKDPDLRYQTASEMLRDIDEFKRNPSIVFEYRYFTKDATQYFDAVEAGEQVVLKKRMSPVMQVLIAVTLAMLLMAGAAIWIFFQALGDTKPDLMVEQFVGQLYEDVQNNPVYQQKYVIFVDKRQMSDQYEAGVIIAQKPEAGTQVKQGQKVALIVSLGLNVQTIPKVAGETREVATQILESAGFIPIPSERFSDDVDIGLTISTNPEEGAVARKNQEVQVYISIGRSDAEDITIPKVLGMQQDTAVRILESEGLTVVTQIVDSPQAEGVVIHQSIQEDARVPKNTTITLQISNGKSAQKIMYLNVQFADAINDNVTFVTIMNGAETNRQTINPSTQSLQVPLTGSGSTEVLVTVDGRLYASYRVNFDTEQSTPVLGPNTDLISPY